MKKKYYYYVAVVIKDGMAYARGTVSTAMDDFPLINIENYIMKDYKVSKANVIVTFYKEITEDTYKAYNNEQQD